MNLYPLSFCYECPKCKLVMAAYDILYMTTNPDCPACGRNNEMSVVSCQPETSPPVCTAQWNKSSYLLWESEQQKRQLRLDTLNANYVWKR